MSPRQRQVAPATCCQAAGLVGGAGGVACWVAGMGSRWLSGWAGLAGLPT